MPDFKPLDPQNMNGAIESIGANLKAGWQLGLRMEVPDFKPLRQIVICGMGGSAIGGDFATSYLSEALLVPAIAHRNYGLPGWATGPETLVVCSSHSGNTEETLSSYHEALRRGCSIVSITTGGKLADLSAENGTTCWIFDHVGQPRTAIGWSVGLLLALFFRLDLIEDQRVAVEEAVMLLAEGIQKLGKDSPVSNNPAKRLAGQLLERNVVIYGSGGLEVVARRWKTQINELAKAWAVFEGIPEMNHNALAALRHPDSLYEHTSAIFLRSNFEHQRNSKRMELSQQFFLRAGVAVDSVWASGQGKLAQMFSLLQFGDYVSYYLALAYGEDPTPIEDLNELKKLMSE